MLASASTVVAIAEALESHGRPIAVIDPVRCLSIDYTRILTKIGYDVY